MKAIQLLWPASWIRSIERVGGIQRCIPNLTPSAVWGERGPRASARAPIASQQTDCAVVLDTLPRQAQYQGLQLRLGQRHVLQRDITRPHEAALVQAPSCQPNPDAVMHEHLQARGATIGEEIGMVRLGAAEDLNDTGQHGLGASTHVQWRRREPHGVDADQRSSSRIQAAHASAALAGHVRAMVAEPRRISMRMGSVLGAGGAGGAGIGSSMKPTGFSLTVTAPIGGCVLSWTQRRSRLALMP
jgi:hypothetical protein